MSTSHRACIRDLDMWVGAVCSIKDSYGPQNLRVLIVLKASKYAGAEDLRVSATAAQVMSESQKKIPSAVVYYYCPW